MFGKINNVQDISNNTPKLCKHFTFVGVSVPISEKNLLLLIERAYNSKNKIELEKCLNVYKKEYSKSVEIIHKYQCEISDDKLDEVN